MQNPFSGPLEGFNMGAQQPHHLQKMTIAGPHTLGLGVKGPWHLNPGNPDFPNHRPFLSSIKPPGSSGPHVPAQTLTFPGDQNGRPNPT